MYFRPKYIFFNRNLGITISSLNNIIKKKGHTPVKSRGPAQKQRDSGLRVNVDTVDLLVVV